MREKLEYPEQQVFMPFLNEEIESCCVSEHMSCPVTTWANVVAKSDISFVDTKTLNLMYNTLCNCDFAHFKMREPIIEALRNVENEQQKRKDNRGYVYLMQCGPYYKIGLSKNPNERLKQLSTLPPFDIDVIHLIDTYRMHKIEKTLHNFFDTKRKNGEWFELSEQDVNFIFGIKNDSDFDLHFKEKEFDYDTI